MKLVDIIPTKSEKIFVENYYHEVMGQDIYGSSSVFNFFRPNYRLVGLISEAGLVGGGVILPTLSTDEYFAELALWFGVSPNELGTIFPGLNNFYSASSGIMPIGFMG